MNGISPKINLSNEQYKQVEERTRKTKERKLADRLRVVLYKADGHSHKFIAKLVQLGRNQVTKLLQCFNQGGLTALLQSDNYQGSAAKLSLEQQQRLKVELKTKIYATAAQVIAWVQKQWNIVYDLSAMHKLLKRLGYLPPYSPNLNPIERFWKFVRKKFFKDRYRETFAKFCTQLEDFFANLDHYRTELTSLLTENFELLPVGWQPPICA